MLFSFTYGFLERACTGVPGIDPFVRSPQSCSAYILCWYGVITPGSCPEHLSFNLENQTCEPPENVDCTQCSPYGVVQLPHPTDCKRFYDCIFGNREERICPGDLLFDRMIGACNRPQEVQCPGTPPLSTPSPTITPIPTKTTPTATPGTIPTTSSQGTSTSIGTQPPPSSTTQAPQIDPMCLTGQIHHAHPTDCTLFFMCLANGVLWEHQCPSNFHWNERAMACDLPENAHCVPQGSLRENNYYKNEAILGQENYHIRQQDFDY